VNTIEQGSQAAASSQNQTGGSGSLQSIALDGDGSVSQDEFEAQPSKGCTLSNAASIIDVLLTCVAIVGGVGLIRATCALVATKGYKKQIPLDLRFPCWEVCRTLSVGLLTLPSLHFTWRFAGLTPSHHPGSHVANAVYAADPVRNAGHPFELRQVCFLNVFVCDNFAAN